MRCPVCASELTATRYEGLPVFQCKQCDGYLVGAKRVMDIKRRRAVAKSELIETASIEGESDSTDSLRCPRCKMKMKKEIWRQHPSFHVDQCKACQVVWFDTGELARLQLDYEVSKFGQDAARRQDRHQNMTDHDRAEFERNLAKLPEGAASFAAALGQGIGESFGDFMLGFWRLRR